MTGRHGAQLVERIGAGGEDQVDMAVEQAGQERAAGGVDAIAVVAGELRQRCHAFDTRATDQNGMIREQAGAVENQSAGIECCHKC